MKYRAGHGEERMTRSRATIACGPQRGCAAAAKAVVADGAGESLRDAAMRPLRAHGGSTRAALHGQAFWNAHEARIRGMKQRVYARWSGRTHVAGGRGRIHHASL